MGSKTMMKTEDKTLAVGERFNYHKWWRPIPRLEYSLDLRLRMGFYNKTGPRSRRVFLNSLGVVWDDGINLLWPSPITGYWDPVEAKTVVGRLRLKIEEYDTVLLFGSRVCRAFGVRFNSLEQQGVYLPLPHPSGRCRLWNDREFLGQVRRYFQNE